ncbi:MAG TPA: YtxH domain-containing protein [Anaerolineales bacterium]|jgi:gas vesicle protein
MTTRNQESHRNGNRGSATPVVAGFVIGGLVGATTMLLLAPQAGKKTREELQKGAFDLRDRTKATVKDTVTQARSKAEQLTAEARGKAEEYKQKGKDIAVEQLDRIQTAAESGKKALKNV